MLGYESLWYNIYPRSETFSVEGGLLCMRLRFPVRGIVDLCYIYIIYIYILYIYIGCIYNIFIYRVQGLYRTSISPTSDCDCIGTLGGSIWV